MNERDSEAVAAQFLAKGYSLAHSEASADVILLNTCSVRDLAEQKALRKMVALAGDIRHRRQESVLGFMGCMAQSRGAELLRDIPDLDLVVGTQKFHRAVDHATDILEGRATRLADVEEEKGSESTIKEHLPATPGGRPQVSAFVSIMQGCNQYCTFCIVPHTRGLERSRPIDDIVAECRGLVQAGAREITLLGQIVTSFGRREIPIRDGKSPFVQLLEAVSAIDGLQRIRFTSPHPKGYGDDLVEAYARLPKLCESAHIPAQSGSDRLLKQMHRGYTRGRFLEIIAKLRAVRPGIGVTTDLIVGFPGETEDDFQQTLSLVREANFQNSYIFKYSQRRNTPAASMDGQLPEEVKEERHARLLTLQNELGAALYSQYTNRLLPVLVEGPSRRNEARLEGRTSCNKIVVFEGAPRHIGQIIDLRITRAGSFTLYGDPAILNPD